MRPALLAGLLNYKEYSMKNRLLFLYSITLISLSSASLFAKGDETVEEKTASTSCPVGDSSCSAQVGGTGHKTAVIDCAGAGTECAAVINAVGDVVNVNVSSYPVKDLGIISQDKKAPITLPEEPGKTIYSITPTSGESAKKTIVILFDHTVPRPGSADFFKKVIKIYRQFKGDNPMNWTEVGMISSTEKKLGDVTVTFKTDGTAVYTDPTGKLHVFALGKIKLKS